MEKKNVLVKEGDVALITCPFCRKATKLSVGQYREKGKRELRIKCCCEKLFCVGLEYRKHPRKPVRLLGRSINLSRHRESNDILIKNISLGGICFSPFSKHKIRQDDKMQVSFTLNDASQTIIDASARVRTVSPDYICCKFTGAENFSKSLGFYLFD